MSGWGIRDNRVRYATGVCVLVPLVEKLQRKGLLLMHNSVQYLSVAWRGWVAFLLQLLIFPGKALAPVWKWWQDASTKDTHHQVNIKWYLKKGGGGGYLHCSMKDVDKKGSGEEGVIIYIAMWRVEPKTYFERGVVCREALLHQGCHYIQEDWNSLKFLCSVHARLWHCERRNTPNCKPQKYLKKKKIWQRDKFVKRCCQSDKEWMVVVVSRRPRGRSRSESGERNADSWRPAVRTWRNRTHCCTHRWKRSVYLMEPGLQSLVCTLFWSFGWDVVADWC